MLKQRSKNTTAHKIRNHLTIIQNEVALSDGKTIGLTKKIVKNEVKTIRGLLNKL